MFARPALSFIYSRISPTFNLDVSPEFLPRNLLGSSSLMSPGSPLTEHVPDCTHYLLLPSQLFLCSLSQPEGFRAPRHPSLKITESCSVPFYPERFPPSLPSLPSQRCALSSGAHQLFPRSSQRFPNSLVSYLASTDVRDLL